MNIFSKFSEIAGIRYRLKFFHEMADTVPAYADFLRKNKINPKDIKGLEDLKSVPAMNKKNYLRAYPLAKLCFGGTLSDKASVYTATSGSTGDPFYFPRNDLLDEQSSWWHKIFLDNVSRGKLMPTLVIDCFGMGVWIGGLITYQAFKILAQKGYPISIITPGSNKQEIFHTLKNIAGHYKQVIICGYPPFVKDLIDESDKEGINMKKMNIKFLFAAEGFSEKFREYVASAVGMKNILFDTANIYGSADLGTMAMETPLSILIRRIALENKKLFNAIFSNINKTPTLAQFNPTFTDFEVENGPSTPIDTAPLHEGRGSREQGKQLLSNRVEALESGVNNVLCSGRSVVPLFKYAIGDHGGVIKFKEMVEIFKKEGFDLNKLAKRAGIKNSLSLPFVYVYERADLSTKLYGAIIYPEHIKQALLHGSVNGKLTGKFTIETVHDKEENQYLQVHIECKSGQKVRQDLEKKIRKLIVDALLLNNAEYAYLTGMMPGRVIPKLTLWPYEHPEYFKKGGKQKWVK